MTSGKHAAIKSQAGPRYWTFHINWKIKWKVENEKKLSENFPFLQFASQNLWQIIQSSVDDA